MADTISNIKEGRALTSFNKKRYSEIESQLTKKGFDESAVASVLETLRTVLNFDPSATIYTPDHRERVKEYRKKKQLETGLSTYQILNQKKYYEEHKEEIKKKVQEKKNKLKSI